MDDVVKAINDLITDHWVKFVVAAGFTGLGWLFGRWRTRREWQKREFFHRINFSLNSIIDGTLKIRTLAEKTCSDVFLNETAVKEITAAAQKTKAGLPLIPMAKDDCWFYLNAVLNEISEQFANGLMARESGKDVKATHYVICLTNEADGEVKTRKIRAQVIRKDLLANLPKETPAFESPHHRVRWETLMHLAQAYQKEPWQFLSVEIVS